MLEVEYGFYVNNILRSSYHGLSSNNQAAKPSTRLSYDTSRTYRANL